MGQQETEAIGPAPPAAGRVLGFRPLSSSRSMAAWTLPTHKAPPWPVVNAPVKVSHAEEPVLRAACRTPTATGRAPARQSRCGLGTTGRIWLKGCSADTSSVTAGPRLTTCGTRTGRGTAHLVCTKNEDGEVPMRQGAGVTFTFT